ncbi:MAG: hypothetical protein AAGF91_07080 [Actinomycetota bacterium]
MPGTPLDREQRRMLGEWLGRYVYILVDPNDGIPFYVGRGIGDRVAQHGDDATKWADTDEPAGPKIDKIREIRRRGDEPDIVIVRRQIRTQAECNAVEAALIDLLFTFPVTSRAPVTPIGGSHQLTNLVRGQGSDFGLETLSTLVNDLLAPPLTTSEPLLIIALGPWTDQPEAAPGGVDRPGWGWKTDWAHHPDLDQLGDSVRCWWSRLNDHNVHRRNVRHVVATYRGITRGLFEILDDTWEYRDEPDARTRGGFQVRPVTNGALWDDVVGLRGHRLPDKRRGDQSTYRYWPYRT